MPTRSLSDVAALRRLGRVIAKHRITKDLTQEVVAERAGMSVAFLRRVERGKGNPSYLTLKSFALALDVDLVALIRDCEEERGA